MKKWKVFVVSIGLTLLAGVIAGLLTMGNMGIYSFINRPPLSPPSWLFPVVWTILYILMGVSVSIYYIKTNTVPGIYILQLLVIYFYLIKQLW